MTLAGFAPLLRLALRRDRVLVPVSAVALAAFAVGSAKATVDLYPSAAAARAGLGSVLTSPALVALYGPASDSSLAGLSVLKSSLMGAVFVGVLAYAVVRRHTRVEEEAGRLELLESGVVDRRTPLVVAVTVALLAVVLTALLTTAGLSSLGFAVGGSVTFGLAWCGIGLVMAGVTAVAAQLTSSARGVAAWALGALGVGYLMRAVGDVAPGAGVLSWISPIGWASKMSAYDADRLWVFALSVVLAAVLIAVAFLLLDRRDLGAGLLVARPGPPRADRLLSSPEGLVWRLDRATVLGWAICGIVLGLVVGGLTSSVQDMLSDPSVADMLRRLGGGAGTLEQIYVATELRFVAVGFAACGIALALHMSTEEHAGRTEVVLAAATSRARWFAAHAGVALGASTLLLGLTALIMGALGHHLATDAPTAWDCVLAAFVCAPAVWVVVACGLLAVAVVPRFAAAVGWTVLAITFVLGEFGTTLRVPTWLIDVSPFAHMDIVAMGSVKWVPWAVLTLVASGLLAVAVVIHGRRDIPG